MKCVRKPVVKGDRIVKKESLLDLNQKKRPNIHFFMLWLLPISQRAVPLQCSCETTTTLGIRIYILEGFSF
ncbi:hypothetical protein EVA_22050 [gut metagenome]|uniref:Uncharacterized protein n=1 Tax=gut metagenome TaxID=749906 RepID=J9F5R6_9ZZZZ